MYIEEIHIYRYLHALGVEIFRFENLLYDHNFTISDRCDDIVTGNCPPYRNSEEEDSESHDKQQDTAQRI